MRNLRIRKNREKESMDLVSKASIISILKWNGRKVKGKRIA